MLFAIFRQADIFVLGRLELEYGIVGWRGLEKELLIWLVGDFERGFTDKGW